MTYSPEWRAFYQGKGPMPQPDKFVGAPEDFTFEAESESITHLGGGWYQVGNAKVQGLSRALSMMEEEE